MIQLNIKPQSSDCIDLLAALFHTYSVNGIEIKESELDVFCEDQLVNSEEFKNAIQTWKRLHSFEVKQLEVPNINWNKEWESNFDPVIVEDILTIKADFHQIDVETTHLISINPKMSFGTGHHATTWMMVKAMSLLECESKSFLDAGTGTGILAILAHQKGAKQITAFDNDEWSYTNALENFSKNDTSDICLFEGSLENVKENEFDIVLANINRNFLLENASELRDKVSLNGFLIISGFLVDDCKKVINHFCELDLMAQYLQERDKWACLILKRTAK